MLVPGIATERPLHLIYESPEEFLINQLRRLSACGCVLTINVSSFARGLKPGISEPTGDAATAVPFKLIDEPGSQGCSEI